MNNSDLADIRARLRAAAEERRPAPKGPLRRLRGLLGAEPPPSLLGPSPVYQPRPAPRPIIPVDVPDEPLMLDRPVLPPPRRSAFGQRPEVGTEPPRPPAPVIVLHTVADDDVAEAIRRVRSPRLRRLDEVIETPFLPEDLADHGVDDVDSIYARSRLEGAADRQPATAPEPAPPRRPTAAELMLLVLEQRILAEHMALIRVIAGV